MSQNIKIIILIAVIVSAIAVSWWLYQPGELGSYDIPFAPIKKDEAVQKLQAMSDSDETESIEMDLNQSSYSGLTAELDLIEAELAQ